MKRLSYILLFLLLLNFSCTKNKIEVHFHGRVTLDCNHQIPIKNCTVDIFREFDTGQHGYNTVGSVITDNNGYFSLTTNVEQKGGFLRYGFVYHTDILNNPNNLRKFDGYDETKDNDDDIEINSYISSNKAYKFHIKNMYPCNSGDVFNSLIVTKLNRNGDPVSELTHIENLAGLNVDTIIYQFYFDAPKIDYKYSHTKNGILTTILPDTLSIPDCLDTVGVNIFY